MLEFRLKHQLTIKLFQEDRDIGISIVQDVMGQVENEILSFISDKVRIAIDNKQIQDCDPELNAFILMKFYIAFIFDLRRNHDANGTYELVKIFDIFLLNSITFM